jgi:hypothetical protein
MRLPVRRFHQLLRGDAAGPLQQFQDLGGLATVAGFGLGGTALLCALGRFLARLAFLPALALAGATRARRAPAPGFFVAFGLSPAAGAAAVLVSSVVSVVISVFSLAVITAVRT